MSKEIIDIGIFTPEPTCEVEIKSPAGAPTGWVVTVAGDTHPKVIAHNEVRPLVIPLKAPHFLFRTFSRDAKLVPIMASYNYIIFGIFLELFNLEEFFNLVIINYLPFDIG